MSTLLLDLDNNFGSWEDLVSLSAGPSKPRSKDTDDVSRSVTKLVEEIESWEKVERESEEQLSQISSSLPTLLSATLSSLQSLQEQARSLSEERWGLTKELAQLEEELVGIGQDGLDDAEESNGDTDTTMEDEPTSVSQAHDPQDPNLDTNTDISTSISPITRAKRSRATLLHRLRTSQARLESLEAGLRWAMVLERVMGMAQSALLPPSTSTIPTLPSFLPPFRSLHALISSLYEVLPQEMTLRKLTGGVEGGCWETMRGVLGSRLSQSLTSIGWPKVIDYPSVPLENRRAFERAFKEMLVFQAEGEKLALSSPASESEITATRLYPFDIMVEPIDARFRFHFEGTRNTNRLDKPEWAFSHILDLMFEQKEFVEDYLQPLLDRCGFSLVDAKSELINALLPLPLKLLQHRFSHLLSHPALLAHTIYQSVQFDDAIRDSGFEVNATWGVLRQARTPASSDVEWRGITEEVLKRDGWYIRWLDGEKQFADDRYNEIMASPDAGTLVESDSQDKTGARQTVAASQIRALLEQVTDRYSPLPNIEFKYPFLSTIQVPILENYLAKFTTSLDAFENLASALLRVVPGALAGHASHAGLAMDSAKMTTGVAGLGRLCKAWIGLRSMLEAMRRWDDDVVFIALAAEIEARPQVRRPSDDYLFGPTVFSLLIDRYQAVSIRAEDMIIKQVSGEVERDLRPHLTRRWDTPDLAEGNVPLIDPALMTPLTTYSGQLGHVIQHITGSSLIRIYRGIAAHIANHVTQRAVYAGWSKYTAVGGQELVEDVNAWIDASKMALGPGSVVRRPEAPWAILHETARILALSNQSVADGAVTFGRAVDMAFANHGDQVKEVLQVKELSNDAIRSVMRRRIDCGR